MSEINDLQGLSKDQLLRIIAKQQEEIAGLRHAAVVDALTGVGKKEGVATAIERERRKIIEGGVFSVVFLDIDDFKKFNTKYGQHAGDQVLAKFAEEIKRHCREDDQIYRYGGEEFVLILPNTTALDSYKVIERIRQQCKEAFQIAIDDHNTETISFSSGIASSEDDAEITGIIQNANDAERMAKKIPGKGKTCLNICGTILKPEDVERILGNEQLQGLIKTYRRGEITTIQTSDGKKLTIRELLLMAQQVKLAENGEIGDIKIVTTQSSSEPSPVFAAYLRAPGEKVLSAVRGTAYQIIEQLAMAGISTVPELSNGQYGRLWQYPGKTDSLNLLVTHKCPMDCIYCQQDHKTKDGLSVEVWKRAIDEVTECGKRRGVVLWITGGEPLTIPTITLELIRYAKEFGMYVAINTNAMLITARTAEKLVDVGVDSVNVSLDSSIAFHEDRITRTDGAFSMVMRGLKELARIKGNANWPKVILGYVITNQNAQTFFEFVETMCGIRRGERLSLFNDINPLPVKDASGLYLREPEIALFNALTVPQVMALAASEKLPLLRMKVADIFAANVADRTEREARVMRATQGIYFGAGVADLPCSTAMTSLTILPDGRVFPCTYHREVAEGTEDRIVLGNVKDTSIAEMRQRHFDLLCKLPANCDGARNRVCSRLCGPDLKRIHAGTLDMLRMSGRLAIR